MLQFRRAILAAVPCLLSVLAGDAQAIAPHDHGDHSHALLPSLRVTADALEVAPSLQLDAQRDFSLGSRMAGFQQRHGFDWEIRWDSRGDRPGLVQGPGIALLQGRGNDLSRNHTALTGDMASDLPIVAALARDFIEAEAELIGSQGLELVLDLERSTGFGPGNERWFLEFQQHHRGIPVDGAFVFVRIVHGNIVQFGSERVADVRIQMPKHNHGPADDDFEGIWQQLGFPAGTRVQEWLHQGELRIYPRLPAGQQLATEHSGARGVGYEHVLARRHVFRVDDHATWQVLVDADNSQIIDLRDLTVHVDAVVSGGVYPSTNSDPEINVAFPYVSVSNAGTQVTDIDGVYDYSGGTATATLNGRYFRMADNCGAISLSNSSDGNLDFGGSGGTDCTTPGVGGAGNTHASRTGFYHLTLINAKARSLLPANNWLQGTVTANMNINNQCNATWNGTAVNFYRSGGGCSNTGEIAAVFLHEWGHGMDTNSGGAANENASGEAVGDTFAFLETRDSCIGPNFRPNSPCHNCTSCTGVRDMADFALDGARPLATPANITNGAGLNCGRFACPYLTPQGFPYRGPMGYQGHCESHIASTANWDLTHALVDEFGESGWGRMDAIWYGSLVPSKSAYRVASGGQCNTSASVDGCGATNWYTVFLAADDDDGNLANGTPNGCRIWDSFNAHGIACGARPACTETAVPDFALDVVPAEQSVCVGSSADFDIEVASLFGFDSSVTLSLADAPATATIQFSDNPVQPGGSSMLSIGTPATVAAGSYAMTLSGTAAGSDGHDAGVVLQVDSDVTSAPTLLSPADNAQAVATSPLLSWQLVPGASQYRVEVALDADFDDIIAQADGLQASQWQVPDLQPGTRHHWRVTAGNGCGESLPSSSYAFTTAARYCRQPAIAIPDNNATGVTDTMVLPGDAELASLRLSIQANHSYVGDLSFRLSHEGVSALVIDRPGLPASTWGCSGDNIDVILDDDAALPVEDQCANTVPTIAGVLRPNTLMGPVFAGQPVGGEWSLTVIDAATPDTGTLLEWCLEPVTTSTQPQLFSLGGSVFALSGTGLRLALNDGTPFEITNSGAFAFPEQLPDGASYTVSVVNQPEDPAQVCSVENGIGLVNGADVDNIEVHCRSLHIIGGQVSNLMGSGLTVQLNELSPLPVAGAIPQFQFPDALVDGSNYVVRVVEQPVDPNQTCVVLNGKGSVDGQDVSIQIECTDHHAVLVEVENLIGSGLGLSLNDGPMHIVDGPDFVFPEDLLDGADYAVTVVQQPSDPAQICLVINGTGTIDGQAAQDVRVDCGERIFYDGFQ